MIIILIYTVEELRFPTLAIIFLVIVVLIGFFLGSALITNIYDSIKSFVKEKIVIKFSDIFNTFIVSIIVVGCSFSAIFFSKGIIQYVCQKNAYKSGNYQQISGEVTYVSEPIGTAAPGDHYGIKIKLNDIFFEIEAQQYLGRGCLSYEKAKKINTGRTASVKYIEVFGEKLVLEISIG